MKRKIFIAYAILLVLGGMLGFTYSANAQTTVGDLQAQIQALLAQIAQLQAKIAQLGGGPKSWCYDFNTNLRFGNSGVEVQALQTALQKEGFSAGASGQFDEATASAVVGFQQKYASEILTPLGLKFGTGYVGPSTRAKLNALYGCGIAVPPPPPSGVTLQSISPSSGLITTTITLTGTGFTPTGNDVKIDSLLSNWSGYSGYITNLSPLNNSTLQFVLPPTLDSCRSTELRCIGAALLVHPGDYKISVVNSSGTSNSLIFTVTRVTTSRSIKVLSPNGGEQWDLNIGRPVSFQAVGVERVNIDLEDWRGNPAGGPFTWRLESNLPVASSGKYAVSALKDLVPKVQPGDQFLVRVWDVRDVNLSTSQQTADYSDGYFSIVASSTAKASPCNNLGDVNNDGFVTKDDNALILDYIVKKRTFTVAEFTRADVNGDKAVNILDSTQVLQYVDGKIATFSGCAVASPSITVLSPNGGEVWQIGKAYDVLWNYSGLQECMVNINLTNVKGGMTYGGNNLPILASLGRYSFTVSSNISTGSDIYKMEVIGGKGCPSDESNSYFSIVSATSTPSIAPDPEMVYPVDGQVLNYGSPHWYMFKVKPISGASGYRFQFFQGGTLVYDNSNALSTNGEFNFAPGQGGYSSLKEGDVNVRISAFVNGVWTPERSITIKLARPDLVPTPITWTSSATSTLIRSGDEVVFDSGIQNAGDANAGVFNVKWFVNNAQVGYGSHAGVLAKSTVMNGNSAYTWKVPEGSLSYEIRFEIDTENHIGESNETNNSVVLQVQVYATGCDLTGCG